ncbi:MAG: energy-coupling factor ABC transporter ATP-binding protein [Candidatus Odinarchaeia archaeon]
MIQIENLRYTYPDGSEALKGVSLEIDDGELLVIMGENGAGKTTLIKHLNGLLKPTSGRVVIDGIDTRIASVAELARKVGLVFQNADHQLFSETVEKEIIFTLQNLGFSEEEIPRLVEDVLDKLELTEYRHSSPFALSGGERKRVALASVVCAKPQILVLDEPTIGQDAYQKEKLCNLLRQFKEENKTIIVVTHDVEFAVENFHRAILMANGRIIADGEVREVLTNPKLIEKSSLLPPQITEFCWAIKENVKNFPGDLITVDEAEKHILSFYRR